MESLNRVLIVDDDEVGRKALCCCLEASGYEPTEASDGMEALVQLQTGAYALVITDYRMSGLNGLELLRIVTKTWNVPVLLISGELDEELELMARANDARILRKPFDRETLLPLVKLAVLRTPITPR